MTSRSARSGATPPASDRPLGPGGPFPLVYRQTGAYDADFEVRVGADGAYTVEGGSYVTRGRRAGRLGCRDLARLWVQAAAVEARDWGAPEGADGFANTLRLGRREVRWWGPAADVDPALAAIVCALSVL